MRKHIFNPGPSVLPVEVLQEASEAVVELNGSGESVLEISHRGKTFEGVVAEAKALVKELLGLGEDYDVLFLQGGASLQFCMVPMNFLNESETAAYADTGTWASKAIKEAKLFGKVDVVASSKAQNYNHIPKGFEVPGTAKYFHITTNNTIYGTQFHRFPESPVLYFADMSSDFLSREIPASKFDLIYAGAQKNVGPAGVTLVVLRKELLKRIDKVLPSMLDYRVFVENDSLYNTPCVFGIYVCLLTLRWLRKKGGLKAIEKINETKAARLYEVIDRHPLYKGHAAKEDRSKMNVVFTLSCPELEGAFLEACTKAGIVGIKGHRSVGGFRASLYNALPLESVTALCEVMEEFAASHQPSSKERVSGV
ncbi:MAG TPA: 3-phosphoserine/phosphohydroxythreonine transaminase [Chitinophagales bacterium]|nr:3-phosphoserine/phosphohydroxythreonine transaminase [Chitinophagales bacterium]